MRPLRGVADVTESEEYQRGRSTIERLALSAVGEGSPSLRLTAAECADVLHFMHFSEPVKPKTWWEDPIDEPSHVVGYYMLLYTLDRSLRRR
jgi:hypothetical protein